MAHSRGRSTRRTSIESVFVVLIIAFVMRSRPVATIAALVLAAVPVGAAFQLFGSPALVAEQSVSAFVIAGVIFLLTQVVKHGGKRIETPAIAEQHPLFSPIFSGWLVVSSAAIMLVALARGPVIPSEFTTVAWGVVGGVMLGAGFLFVDKTMRYTSMAVFALAIGRIMFQELAGAPALTKAIAFVGIGILLLIAALAYGFLRSRIQMSPRK